MYSCSRLDAGHEDVLRGHEGQLGHDSRSHHPGPHVHTVGDVCQQGDDHVRRQETFREVHLSFVQKHGVRGYAGGGGGGYIERKPVSQPAERQRPISCACLSCCLCSVPGSARYHACNTLHPPLRFLTRSCEPESQKVFWIMRLAVSGFGRV